MDRRKMTATCIHINGRFLTRPLSGVDRVAEELILAWESLYREQPRLDRKLRIDHPNSDVRPVGGIAEMRGVTRGQFWEHVELPWRSRAGWLLSPCNVGPLFHSRHAVIIHDAQSRSNAQAYSFSFRTWYRLLQPRVARRARLVITVSNFAKLELERYGIVPPGKAHVIHNGSDHIDRITADSHVLNKHGLVAKGYYLAIGSLSPHKNLSLLVSAREAMPQGSAPLVIAGGGNRRVFADAGITPSENVRILGRVTDAELKALYTGATAFLFPSLTEGFGLPPLEAMRCGTPVLATNTGAVPEVCGSSVMSLSPYGSAAWSQAMTEIAANSTLSGRLIRAGLERVTQFTWDRAARQLAGLIAESDGHATTDQT